MTVVSWESRQHADAPEPKGYALPTRALLKQLGWRRCHRSPHERADIYASLTIVKDTAATAAPVAPVVVSTSGANEAPDGSG